MSNSKPQSDLKFHLNGNHILGKHYLNGWDQSLCKKPNRSFFKHIKSLILLRVFSGNFIYDFLE